MRTIFVHIPDMDIATQGNSIENAIKMARDAICLTTVDLEEDDKPIPVGSELSDIKADEKGAIVTLIDADVTAYKRMLDKRAVRKNVTIPSRLNEAAEKKHINFSEALRSALMEQLGMDQ